MVPFSASSCWARPHGLNDLPRLRSQSTADGNRCRLNRDLSLDIRCWILRLARSGSHSNHSRSSNGVAKRSHGPPPLFVSDGSVGFVVKKLARHAMKSTSKWPKQLEKWLKRGGFWPICGTQPTARCVAKWLHCRRDRG